MYPPLANKKPKFHESIECINWGRDSPCKGPASSGQSGNPLDFYSHQNLIFDLLLENSSQVQINIFSLESAIQLILKLQRSIYILLINRLLPLGLNNTNFGTFFNQKVKSQFNQWASEYFIFRESAVPCHTHCDKRWKN